MLSRRSALGLLAATPAALAALPAFSQTAPVFSENEVALRGADPVAYFTESTSRVGNAENATMWNGTTWHFTSAANRDAFVADPEAYAPQYGGYCAYAMSLGSIASTVPEAWTIVDGRLYLNFSRSVRRRWARDIPGNIALANQYWPGILA
jgi:YHS domain-containing protein